MTSVSDAAQDYAQRGLRVFPIHAPRGSGACSCGTENCRTPGKHPRIKDQLNQASSDPSQIEEWWSRWPDANVGIPTGTGTGLLVLDVDPRNGGTESLEALLESHGSLPATWEAESGGGGRHFYFKHPEDVLEGNVKLPPGLDLQGDGKCIIAPPSLHESGNRYHWRKGHSPDETDLAPPPAWLLTPPETEKEPAGAGLPEAQPEAPPRILEGTRNKTLTELAGGFRGKGLRPAEYLPALEAINEQRCLPPLPTDEVADIANSVGRYPSETEVGARRSDPLTDLGNTQRFLKDHGLNLRYLHEWARWLTWDEERWCMDRSGQVDRWAKETVRGIRQAAAQTGDSRDREALEKWANTSESRSRIENMIRLAQSEPGITVAIGDLDADPWKLSVANGTLDLRSGALSRPDRKDLITKALKVDYNPEAVAPRWSRFIEEVTAGDSELSGFLQRSVGYSLTGTVGERCLFFLVGGGANGKSTFLRVLLDLFGDHGTQTEPRLLISAIGDRHPTGVADLQGCRLAVCVEAEGGKSFDHALVKQLTGGDMVKARRMRQDFYQFEPTHHIWMAMNDVPEIDPGDQAMWDRIKVVPFEVRFAPEDQDRALLEGLREEMEGILAWAVRGCLEWRQKGLGAPMRVSEATDGVRKEMDPVGRFLGEECLMGAGLSVEATPLFGDFKDWCRRNGEVSGSQKAFGRSMTMRDVVRRRCSQTGVTIYSGVGALKDLKDLSNCHSYSHSPHNPKPTNGSEPSEEEAEPAQAEAVR
ncbi:phage/plasmid primase, P4 family [Gemmatimonadota bacterium]